ncbi:hypothetical protein AB0F90_00600 [Micromonospora chalcea]|uniref:hypothetical protein n=1 Tax=Micromonospora TaxID=1873 RepID=UPI0034027285
MWSWLVDRWVRWWWLDVAVVLAVTAGCAWQVAPGTGVDFMGQLSLADRRNVYTDMLTLASIFAGLGGVVFAIFLGLQSRPIVEIKARIGEDLLRVWVSALVAPWFSAFVIIAAKVLDRGGRASANEARWAAVAAAGLVALQLFRILWVFYKIAAIEAQGHVPAIETASTPATIGRKPDPRIEARAG